MGVSRTGWFVLGQVVRSRVSGGGQADRERHLNTYLLSGSELW
ncbi:MAG: hypothetical protein J07HN6_00705 [Halonotius sp. J07HN6]|nr:MAG: hypothetical protein J07HN6_00705 [Halonotius sp. J07HN6]